MNRLWLLAGAALLAVLASPFGCRPPEVAPMVHFALRGAHVQATCSDCHGDSLANATPTTCIGCHLEDRPQNHYEGDCMNCHSEVSWEGAVTDHSFFPLDFGHDGLTCLDCHVEGDFGAADPTCESCHNRPTGHFEGPCGACHTIRTWEDADFNHRDFFPTPHEGVRDCEDCHPSADTGDYRDFTCTDCHAHTRSEMDGEHLGEVGGYTYSSPACLNCHPNGEEDD